MPPSHRALTFTVLFKRFRQFDHPEGRIDGTESSWLAAGKHRLPTAGTRSHGIFTSVGERIGRMRGCKRSITNTENGTVTNSYNVDGTVATRRDAKNQLVQ